MVQLATYLKNGAQRQHQVYLFSGQHQCQRAQCSFKRLLSLWMRIIHLCIILYDLYTREKYIWLIQSCQSSWYFLNTWLSLDSKVGRISTRRDRVLSFIFSECYVMMLLPSCHYFIWVRFSWVLLWVVFLQFVLFLPRPINQVSIEYLLLTETQQERWKIWRWKWPFFTQPVVASAISADSLIYYY